MNLDLDPTDPETISRGIDEAVRRFEAERNDGKNPRTDEYLRMVPEAARQRLLRKLLMLEMGGDEPVWEKKTALDPAVPPIFRPEPPSTLPDHDHLWNLSIPSIEPSSTAVESPSELPTTAPGDSEATIPAGPKERRPFPRVPGFRIVEEIGRGAMGVVYLAFQLDLARVCALKMILAGEHASEELDRRFLAEAQTVARLRHENIVQIFSLGHHDGSPYVELEYVEGGPLSRRLDGTPWNPTRAASLVRSLATAIEEAHRQGVVHRDLKPGNVLIGPGETPKVADFGLAKSVGEDAGLTQTGAILGTPSYMAPEQAEGHSKAVGPPADIYALGAILYELLTGRPPFRAASILQTLEQVRTAEPVPPSRLQPGLPKDLDTICLRCLQKDPSRRYESAGALAEDLRRHIAREPILARPVGIAVRSALWARRNPRVAGLSVAVAALLLVVGLGAVVASLNIAAARKIGRIRQVSQNLQFGLGQVERGNVAGSLLSFVESMRLDEGDDLRQSIHRTRIASILRGCPRPVHTWSPGGPADLVRFRKDGRLALIVGAGRASVFDAENGSLVLGPLNLDDQGGDIKDRATAAAFDAEGRRFLTASGVEARIWEVASAKNILFRYEKTVESAEFSPDGRLAAIAAGNRVFLVDPATGKSAIPKPFEHPDQVRRATFSPDGRRLLVAVGGPEKSIGEAWVWDLSKPDSAPLVLNKGTDGSGESLSITDDVNDAEFSPDGRLIVTASYDHRAMIWDAATGIPLTRLDHRDSVRMARFSPDSTRVLTVSGNETRVWDVKTGGSVLPPLSHRGPVQHATFSPDGRRIASSGSDQSTRIWDARTGALAVPLLTHNGRVNSADFSPDGRFVATASADRSARIWDLATGLAPTRSVWHPFALACAAFDPTGTRVVSLGRDGSCKVWDFATGALLGPVIRCGPGAADAALTAGGEFVATAGDDGVVQVWETRSGKRIGPSVRFPTKATLCAFSPDGSRLLVVSGNRARISDWRTGKSVVFIHHGFPDTAIRHAAFSPDGSLVVTAGEDRAARVWRAKDGMTVSPPFRHTATVRFAAFGPASSGLLVTASDDRTAAVWSLSETVPVPAPLAKLTHNDAVNRAEFSPDGALVVTAGADRTARVWASRTGEAVTPFLEHDEAVIVARFSPDSRFVATGSGNRSFGDVGVARVWDAASGDPVTLPMRHGDGVHSLAFSPDGLRLLTAGGRDSAAHVWSLEPVDQTPAALAEIAEVFSAARIDRLGGQIPVPPEDLMRTHLRLAVSYPKIFSPPREGVLAWYAAESAKLEASKDWPGALKQLDVLLEDSPGDETLHARRGFVLAALGRLDDAYADYNKAIDAGAEDDIIVCTWATLAVRAGDLARYREVCQDRVDRFRDTLNTQRCNNFADMSTIAPSALKDPEVAVRMIGRLIADKPGSGVYLNTLGGALYRAGKYTEAIDRLNAADRSGPSPWNWIFLAMAHRRLGHADEAARFLSKFDADPSTRPGPTGIGGEDWPDFVRFEFLRREAASTPASP